eukprot:jgi/Mesvir1/1700/Mv21159-RA.1
MAEIGKIVRRAYARIGLLGNPSDGFGGKTISCLVKSFYAEVVLTPSEAPGIRFIPHEVHDLLAFPTITELCDRVGQCGPYGGHRLLLATCQQFVLYCRTHGVDLPQHAPGFSLAYDTNVPRQAGLSGSSAIVSAALSCLLVHYGVEGSVPVVDRPQLILDAERSLGITAGLQDRVIQVFGGLVYMDFDATFMRTHGHGRYLSLDPAVLPRLWLIYCDNPSESGKVHNNVRQRYDSGDPVVVQGMRKAAALAQAGFELLMGAQEGQSGAADAGAGVAAGSAARMLRLEDVRRLAELMDQNFDNRRAMYGDAVLGETNLRMIATARSVGAAAKFTGSGGAIVALCPEGEAQEARLKDACAAAGFTIQEVVVGDRNFLADAQ